MHTPPVIETYSAPEPTGADPPGPWFVPDTRTPWQLTTTWATPYGPEPNPGPDPDPEPEVETRPLPAHLDVPLF